MYSIVRKTKSCKMINLMVAVLGAAVTFTVFFSAIFISLETFHNCDGNDCPICEMLQLCEETIEQLSDGSIFIAFITPLLFILSLSPIVAWKSFSHPTPVTNMVRMNN